jgi:hypothetical protein
MLVIIIATRRLAAFFFLSAIFAGPLVFDHERIRVVRRISRPGGAQVALPLVGACASLILTAFFEFPLFDQVLQLGRDVQAFMI